MANLSFDQFLALCGGISMPPGLYGAVRAIERMQISQHSRSLMLSLCCGRLLDWQEIRFLERVFSEKLSLSECRLIPRYAPELLSGEYREVIVNELRRMAVPVNGFFDNSTMALEGDNLLIARFSLWDNAPWGRPPVQMPRPAHGGRPIGRVPPDLPGRADSTFP